MRRMTHRGYILPKEGLTETQQKKIRSDLTITPFTPGAPVQNTADVYYVYRESPTSFYVPYHYGTKEFGPPSKYDIFPGAPIHVAFQGQLRDYQLPVLDQVTDHLKSSPCGGGLLELYTAWGKTAGALCLVSRMAVRTLVIVHKEFLMNQWVERIRTFLPDARIGKIQGAIIDVDNKDIVLCMLQSLVQKEYPKDLFYSFGLTIVDECHHISSRTFSTALFKVVTRYMIGLSATMERKDGTTHVFKMFLGPVLYKAVRDTSQTHVEIRAMRFESRDESFNDTILDFHGKPQVSSMISKLCEYNHRTEFVLDTLRGFLQKPVEDEDHYYIHSFTNGRKICQGCEQLRYLLRNTCCGTVTHCLPCVETIQSNRTKSKPKCPHCLKMWKYEPMFVDEGRLKPMSQAHVIVMSHNLNILHYMYRKIVTTNMASVGYYVGGMKEAELKKSETKQVILSTYTMVSEGLDIPSLNTEFLITPKTDVVQTVGRILRAKHVDTHPIIYDFVDIHGVFQRQWAKRRAYYKSQKYTIVLASNVNPAWKTLFDPQRYRTTVGARIAANESGQERRQEQEQEEDEEDEEDEEQEEDEDEEDEEDNDVDVDLDAVIRKPPPIPKRRFDKDKNDVCLL